MEDIYLPEEYKKRMREMLKDEYESFEKSLSSDPVRALRVNTLKGDDDLFISNNPWGISDKDKTDICPDAFYMDPDLLAGTHPLHQAGAFYIQEPSAMKSAMMLDVRPGHRVLDLCAAPGGKSTQIASCLKGRGLLVSNEIVKSRASILSGNIERMGIKNCLVISHDPKEISEVFKGFFDRVLVDAPCSGEGMFRKNPEAVKEWSPGNVSMCAQRQKDILDHAVMMLKEGGKLVYSTCTFSPEEDEENAEYLCRKYPYLKLCAMEKLYPHKIKGEGHFVALFEKTDQDGASYGYRFAKQNIKEKDLKVFRSFEEEYLRDFSGSFDPGENIYIRNKDELYICPKDMADPSSFKVLRSGLHLGTLKKDYFLPSHSLALFLKKDGFKNTVDLNEEESYMYQRGESLYLDRLSDTESTDIKNGFVLLMCGPYSLGFGKINNGLIKNHFPKGLRVNV